MLLRSLLQCCKRNSSDGSRSICASSEVLNWTWVTGCLLFLLCVLVLMNMNYRRAASLLLCYRFFVGHDATMTLQFLLHLVCLYFGVEIILLLSSVFHVFATTLHVFSSSRLTFGLRALLQWSQSTKWYFQVLLFWTFFLVVDLWKVFIIIKLN